MIRDLPVPELPEPDYDSAIAIAVNEKKEIVGVAIAGLNRVRAVKWDREGNGRDINTIPGAYNSHAVDINDSGVVVGTIISNVFRGFIYTEETGMRRLEDFIESSRPFTVEWAYSINNSGQIAASVRDTLSDVSFFARLDPCSLP